MEKGYLEFGPEYSVQPAKKQIRTLEFINPTEQVMLGKPAKAQTINTNHESHRNNAKLSWSGARRWARTSFDGNQKTGASCLLARVSRARSQSPPRGFGPRPTYLSTVTKNPFVLLDVVAWAYSGTLSNKRQKLCVCSP